MIFIFLHDDGYVIRESENDIEKEIRYWLGKSPGIHDMKNIYVIPNDAKDWAFVQYKVRQEELEHEEQLEEEQQRALYERLKSKYEGPRNTA